MSLFSIMLTWQMATTTVNNAIGDRGEAIFTSVITTFHGRLPLFRPPRFLGEKWPFADFVCELEGPWTTIRPFFFVQVKSTRAGYTKDKGCLKVSISRDAARGLAGYQAPIYVAGVDARRELVYIVGVAGRIVTLPSLHTGTTLDAAGRRALWEEVRGYWRIVRRPAHWTSFRDPLWK
jgi:hypothetical protein